MDSVFQGIVELIENYQNRNNNYENLIQNLKEIKRYIHSVHYQYNNNSDCSNLSFYFDCLITENVNDIRFILIRSVCFYYFLNHLFCKKSTIIKQMMEKNLGILKYSINKHLQNLITIIQSSNKEECNFVLLHLFKLVLKSNNLILGSINIFIVSNNIVASLFLDLKRPFKRRFCFC